MLVPCYFLYLRNYDDQHVLHSVHDLRRYPVLNYINPLHSAFFRDGRLDAEGSRIER